MNNKQDNRLKTPIKTISTSTEFSDYRINASKILKENFLIRNSFREKSRNYNSYLKNFHHNSYNKTRNNNSNNTINSNSENYNNNKDNYYSKTINVESIKKRNSFFNFYKPKKNIISRNKNISKNSYGNKSEEIFIPPLIKSTGNKQLYKLDYGRLQKFNEYSKEIRHEKYIKNFLGNELYFKQSEGDVSSQLLDITKFGKKTTANLFNSFYSTFHQYSKTLNRTLDFETDKNENKILIENKLRNEIVRLNLKKEIMLNKITEFMEMKKFLLCVKNKTLDINKFTEEDKKKVLYDIERKKLIINDYIIPKKKSNTLISKRRESKNNIGKTIIIKHSHLLSNFNIRTNRRSSTKIIYENHYSPLINENIFNNVEEVHNQFLILNEEIKYMLTIYNKKKIEIEKLKATLRDINEENEVNLIEKNKFINSQVLNKIEKKYVLKERYHNLISTKNNILNSSFKKKDKLIEIINQKINLIFNYINLNYKKYSEKIIIKIDDIRNPLINQLDFIEKILIELTDKINKLIKEQPDKYKEITKNIIIKVKHDLFLNNKKIQKEKYEKNIQNIQKRINKIYFLPIKKIQEKFPFSNKNNKKNKKQIQFINLKSESQFNELLEM